MSPFVSGSNLALGTTMLLWHKPRTTSFSLPEESEAFQIADVFKPNLHQGTDKFSSRITRYFSARSNPTPRANKT
jgi:hypothetical protein